MFVPGLTRLFTPSLTVESSPGNAHHWFFLDRALSRRGPNFENDIGLDLTRERLMRECSTTCCSDREQVHASLRASPGLDTAGPFHINLRFLRRARDACSRSSLSETLWPTWREMPAAMPLNLFCLYRTGCRKFTTQARKMCANALGRCRPYRCISQPRVRANRAMMTWLAEAALDT